MSPHHSDVRSHRHCHHGHHDRHDPHGCPAFIVVILRGIAEGHDFPLQSAIDVARIVDGRHIMHRRGAQVRPIQSTVIITRYTEGFS